MKKTKLMRQVEEHFGIPLEKLVLETIQAYGLTDSALFLGVKIPTLYYWALKMGVRTRWVALSPGEEIEIRKAS
jgi:hypothetical protein